MPVINEDLQGGGMIRVRDVEGDGPVRVMLLSGFGAVSITHNARFPPALKNWRPSRA